jgi:hypothetical protein
MAFIGYKIDCHLPSVNFNFRPKFVLDIENAFAPAALSLLAARLLRKNRRTHYAPEISLVVKSRASSLRPSPRRNMESHAITTRKMKPRGKTALPPSLRNGAMADA